MKLAGVIIAGGRSSRMGGNEKALIAVDGKPLIQRVIERLRPQVDQLAINANGDPSRFVRFGLPVFKDRLPIGTPLAGIEVALRWAAEAGADQVLTVPSDAPDLPFDLVVRLAGSSPAIAASGGQDHYLTGLWPVGLLDLLAAAIETEGLRAVKDFARLANVNRVTWDVGTRDPFLNLNSPEDIAAYETH
jgi:molybdopterin-guanine dinucleotide biosynthesis protein A